MMQMVDDEIAMGDGPTQLTEEVGHDLETGEKSRRTRYGRMIRPPERFGGQIS